MVVQIGTKKSKLLVNLVRLNHITIVLLNGAQKILLLMLVLSFVEMASALILSLQRL